MSAVAGILFLIFVAPYLARTVAHARNASWAGPRTPAMRGRALKAPSPVRGTARKAARSAGSAVLHPRSGHIRAQAKADSYAAWQQVLAANYLEAQRHARAGGTPAPGDGGPAAGASPALRQRVLGRFAPSPAAPSQPPASSGTPARRPANGTSPAQGNGRPPAHPSPPPAPPSSNGGNPVAAGTSTASAEKAIEGVNEIYAHGMSGGIHAKQEAMKAIHELAVRASGMVVAFARQMSEPGSNYGTEITEPLATAGTHFQAAASSVSESDAALSTLINMTVGDLAASARQAPHHRELSESGSR